jgi:hypothetical protein
MEITSVSMAVAVVMIASFQLRFASTKRRAAYLIGELRHTMSFREVVAVLQRSLRAATSENAFKFLRAVDRAAFLFDRKIILAENDAVAKRSWRDVVLNGFTTRCSPSSLAIFGSKIAGN